MRLPCLIAVLLGLGVRPAASQTCTDPHYRWTEKVDESLASITPVRTTIRAMITTWGLPAFTGQAQYTCADREGRELRVYSLLGWVRRVKTAEDDGDWHVELTSRRDSPTDSCIVAEIPPVELSGNYGQARTDLGNLVSWNSQGDVAQPVRLRVIGAAFFDGEHRGGPTRRDQTDGSHGRCKFVSARAVGAPSGLLDQTAVTQAGVLRSARIARRANTAQGMPTRNMWTAMLNPIYSGSFDPGRAAESGTTTPEQPTSAISSIMEPRIVPSLWSEHVSCRRNLPAAFRRSR